MFPENNITYNHRSGYADGFENHMAHTWPVDEFGTSTQEWAYTTSEQNNDDLFLAIPHSSRTWKSQHLRQFKEHCRQIIGKFMRQRK